MARRVSLSRSTKWRRDDESLEPQARLSLVGSEYRPIRDRGQPSWFAVGTGVVGGTERRAEIIPESAEIIPEFTVATECSPARLPRQHSQSMGPDV
jgi:hypothetical protein